MHEAMKRSGGPIVRDLRFPPGHTVSRCFPLWAIVITLEGQAEIEVQGGQTVRVGPGDVHVMRPEVAWSRRIVGEAEWVTMSVTFAVRAPWVAWLRLPERAPGLAVLHVSAAKRWGRLARRFREMARLYEGAGPLYRERIMNRTEDVILLLREQMLAEGFEAMDERIIAAVELIRTNLRKPLSVEQLAEACYMSRSRFAELFREQVGHTPAAFVNLCRIDRAKDLLLLTHEPIYAIAEEVGLADPKHFARVFGQLTETTPTRFRRERRPSVRRQMRAEPDPSA